MTDKLREAAQQALSTFRKIYVHRRDVDVVDGAIEKLRAALAQQDAQAVLQGWRVERVSDDDVRVYGPDAETWLLRANPGKGTFEDFAHRFCFALASCPQPEAAPPGQQDAQAVPQVTEQMFAAGQHAWMTADGVDPARVFVAMLNAAPMPPAPKPLGWLDRKAVECLQGAELSWMPAWNRPTSADPVPVFLGPPAQRVMLTDEEIEDLARGKSGHSDFARDIIEAYERKNGLRI